MYVVNRSMITQHMSQAYAVTRPNTCGRRPADNTALASSAGGLYIEMHAAPATASTTVGLNTRLTDINAVLPPDWFKPLSGGEPSEFQRRCRHVRDAPAGGCSR